MTSEPDADLGTGEDPIAQFEPDPDRTWTPEAAPAATAAEGGDDPQWIVWLDAARESAWAAAELTVWTAALRVAGRTGRPA